MLHACIVCGVLVGSGDAERDCMNGYGRDATKRVFHQRGQGLFDAINFNILTINTFTNTNVSTFLKRESVLTISL